MTAPNLPSAPDSPRYLEDFAVGDRFETGEYPLSREQILAFATQYDPQPMHLDEDAARRTIFGEFIGSGWQTLLITMELILKARILGSTPVAAAEFREVRFHAPSRPGDILQASLEVLAIRPSRSRPDRGLMDVKVSTRTTSGTMLITQQWSLVLPCRPSEAAGTGARERAH